MPHFFFLEWCYCEDKNDCMLLYLESRAYSSSREPWHDCGRITVSDQARDGFEFYCKQRQTAESKLFRAKPTVFRRTSGASFYLELVAEAQLGNTNLPT